ncbi:MAG: hypothetical protein LJE91_12660 [Gammaproteobacteria bacterium]|nr:hypothetical protein [Gammaproteobacteria bacterium]
MRQTRSPPVTHRRPRGKPVSPGTRRAAPCSGDRARPTCRIAEFAVEEIAREHAVRNGLVCVESAVTAAIDALAQILREADNEYLRDREEDLRDLRACTGVVGELFQAIAGK